MVSLLYYSVSVAQPSILLMFIGSITESGDGKGCLGVSQDTPSVWGRGSCQPDSPLPVSLRSLWLRFKQNTELKQKREREPRVRWRRHCQTASLKHSTQENPSCQKARWFCVHSLLWKDKPMLTQTYFLWHTYRDISPWAGILRLLYLPAKQKQKQKLLWEAGKVIKHLRFYDSRKVPTRRYDSAGVSSCPLLPCVTLVSIPYRGRCWGRWQTFLANDIETQTHVFQSPLVPVVSWIFSGGWVVASVDLLVISEGKLYPWGKVWDKLETSPFFCFSSSFHYSRLSPHSSPHTNCLFVSKY